MTPLALLLCLTMADGGKAPAPKAAPQAAPTGIDGYYTVRGTDAGGKPYTGIAVIHKAADIHVVSWLMSGGSSFTGVGVRTGDTFAVGWALAGPEGRIIRGVNLYRIEGRRLVGRWASLPGGGVAQREELAFLRDVEPEGDDQ